MSATSAPPASTTSGRRIVSVRSRPAQVGDFLQSSSGKSVFVTNVAEMITNSLDEAPLYLERRDPLLVVDLTGKVVAHGTTKTVAAAGDFGSFFDAIFGEQIAIDPVLAYASSTVTPAASTTFEIGVRDLLDLKVPRAAHAKSWLLAIQLTTKLSTAFLSQWVIIGLKRFVERLARDQEEFEEEAILPNPAGFEDLLAFLSTHQRIRMPGLTVTQDGAFAAIWDHGQRARIRLDFVGGGKVKWVVASEGPANELIGGSGVARIAALDKIIAAYEAEAWMIP